jgi:hypothetical protein
LRGFKRVSHDSGDASYVSGVETCSHLLRQSRKERKRTENTHTRPEYQWYPERLITDLALLDPQRDSSLERDFEFREEIHTTELQISSDSLDVFQVHHKILRKLLQL